MTPSGDPGQPQKPLTLDDLDARLREVEALQSMMLRILATTNPLDRVLQQYGATTLQEQAFHRLLGDLAERAKGPEDDRPTFGYFVTQMDAIFPSLRGDRAFVELVLGTLKVERPAYRAFHGYAVAAGWPAWNG